MNILRAVTAALSRRVLGISADEIRYTIEDIRKEIRAVRSEAKGEIATLRTELEALSARLDGEDKPGTEIPVAEA